MTSNPTTTPTPLVASSTTTSPVTTAATITTASACNSCAKPLEGQFVRALGGCYHLNCFQCLDCGQVVAARFFPYQDADGHSHPLCERDYFRRLNLLCANCNEALRGSYITAVGRKYHLDHFTCSVCPTVFGPDETYYEHDGEIYCHVHYSLRHAVRCGGCNMAILKQFVEVKMGSGASGSGTALATTSAASEQWHPECYMIFKSWNIRMNPTTPAEIPATTTTLTVDQLKLEQRVVEEKVNRIWTVLSAFEESAAACISDMLLHVSNQSYMEAVGEAGNFIIHVEVLFQGVDALEEAIAKHGDNIGLSYNREPKLLSKKIVNFFSLLSQTQSGSKQYGAVTQELLSLVTSLAQNLKTLIRIVLAGALKLERKYGVKTAIGDFLNKLMEVGQTTGGDRGSSTDLKFDSLFKTTNLDVKSDLCMACRSSVEESCIHFQSHIWHSACFFCVGCQKDLNSREGVSVARYDSVENRVYCEKCAHPSAVKGFEQVTQLQQYTFLLRVALKRLYGLLKAKDDRQLSSSRLLVPPVASGTTSTRDSMQSIESREAGPTVESTSRSKSYLALDDMQAEVRKSFGGDLNEESGPLSAKGETTHGFDGPVGARALLQPQDSVHNLIEDTRLATPVTDASVPRIQSAKSLPVPVPTQPANATTDTDHPWPIAPATAASKSPSTAADTTRPFARAHVDGTSTRQPMYLAELSALEYFIVRHLAVIKLHPLVGDVYTHSDLVALVRAPKQSLWSRMMSTLKPGKKQPKQKDGTFGVPLNELVDRYGVDTKHGSGMGRLRIPAFFDLAVATLKSTDLRVEGIFRKNGNIKQLNALAAQIERDPWSQDIRRENAIQIAALMKKFLREMPEPLLTFKLYKLFLLSQKVTDAEARLRILQYAIMLLPKENRDLLEVIVGFIRLVASFADGEGGNKMDTSNLAVVFAPNILYSKVGKEKPERTVAVKDESFLAIEVIKAIVQHQDLLWQVPDEVVDVISSDEIAEGATDLSSKDVIRKYEQLLSGPKKSASSRELFGSSILTSMGNSNAQLFGGEPRPASTPLNGTGSGSVGQSSLTPQRRA